MKCIVLCLCKYIVQTQCLSRMSIYNIGMLILAEYSQITGISLSKDLNNIRDRRGNE